jgi:hypothetical protein
MKNIYFLVAALVLIFQSCTIQKRQHLPGYHIEWNTTDSHSEVQREKTLGQSLEIEQHEVALAAEEVATPVGQEVLVNNSDAELASPSDLDSDATTVNGNEAAKFHSEKRTKQRLTFPSIIHAPAKMLFGGVNPDDKPRTDGMSIAAMVCGIVGVLLPGSGIILSILAIIFGGVGMGRTSRNPELKGKGMAITGLVLGIVGLLVTVLVLAVLSSYWWY